MCKFSAVLLILVIRFQDIISDPNEDSFYDFQPESRHIDVNDGDSYIVSFSRKDYLRSFTKCYYDSETIKGWYDIDNNMSTPPTSMKLSTEKSFKPYTTICGFIVHKVNADAPREWTITVFDEVKNKNYTEHVTVTFYYDVPVIFETTNVLIAGSYYNFLDETKTDIKIKSCNLIIGDESIGLNLEESQILGNSSTVFSDRAASIGYQKCGFKVKNAKLDDPYDLFLAAQDAEGKKYRHKIRAIVVDKSDHLINRTKEEFLGATTLLICGDAESIDQKYCHLFNPKGEFVLKAQFCLYEIDIVTLGDFGQWTCSVGFDSTMENVLLSTTLIQKKKENVIISSTDEGSFVTVGCQLEGYSDIPDYCMFTRPDNIIFRVYDSAATERYTTFNTNLKAQKCSIEIPKPLTMEEKGSWKCEFHMGINSRAGGFVNVEVEPTSLLANRRAMNTYARKIVHINRPFTIYCAVFFSSDHCYIVAPNGTHFKNDDPMKTSLGECSWTVQHANSSDDGNWTCFFAQDHGLPDIEIPVMVSIVETRLNYVDTDTLRGEAAILTCNTEGIPLNYCRFISPTGVSYSLKKDQGESDLIAYSGRGLDYGDCGVNIRKTTENDHGYWKCFVSLGRNENPASADLSQEILLTVREPEASGPSLAQSVGLTMGILVAIAAMCGVAFYKYSARFTCLKRVNSAENLSGRRSNESGNVIILQDQTNNNNPNYNTNSV